MPLPLPAIGNLTSITREGTMMPTFSVDFVLQDRVRIKPLERIGVVVSVWWSEMGLQYQVRYFDNASAQIVYFFKEELEHVGDPEKPAFLRKVMD